ncbi:MAG TPA: hypothetical protein VNL91_00490 [Thermoanaerobaculia bacterium]|nr:hypothetical protein [Thermoanaerobaculia bacterium]
MKFIIEQLFLNDDAGKPLPKAGEPMFHRCEAETPQQALSMWLDAHRASLLGNVSEFYGYQSVATARAGVRIFSLHVYPGSDMLPRAKSGEKPQDEGKNSRPPEEPKPEAPR